MCLDSLIVYGSLGPDFHKRERKKYSSSLIIQFPFIFNSCEEKNKSLTQKKPKHTYFPLQLFYNIDQSDMLFSEQRVSIQNHATYVCFLGSSSNTFRCLRILEQLENTGNIAIEHTCHRAYVMGAIQRTSSFRSLQHRREERRLLHTPMTSVFICLQQRAHLQINFQGRMKRGAQGACLPPVVRR